MEPPELLRAIRREGEAMAAAADGHLDRPVPSCPGWDVARVVDHVGRIHRWVAAMVEAGATERPPFPPRSAEVGAAWLRYGVSALVATLEAAGPDAPVWNFRVDRDGLRGAAGPGTARFWFRRQAVETAVHRWDVELAATGTPGPIEGELGVTGVDEVLDVLVADRPVTAPGSVHLHATDTERGEWTVRADDDGPGLVVGHGHAKGDAAVRGAAGDLLLWLWGRSVPAGRLEAFGDEAVLAAWSPALVPG
ncbi:MAG TPA: maleylpyruvate isomerase family mycothiol-dependent enzyme [Acidimicrobiales bacterium]|nr:maleylpyruvate isomerase family mycothiol-dependent enzyme [Acidimicrobiales bacterium]